MMRYVPPIVSDVAELVIRCWRRRPAFRISATAIALLFILGAFAPIIAPYPKQGLGVEVNPSAALRPPSPSNILGTDDLGRDVFSRVLMGLGRAIGLSLLVISVSLTLGIAVGSLISVLGTVIRETVAAVMELLIAIPSVLLAAALSVIIGGGWATLAIALIATWWPWYGRLAYVQARAVREFDYVRIAEIFGLPKVYIVFRHIAPNIVAPVLVEGLTDIGNVVLEMSTITFLFGLGVSSIEEPDLGLMIGSSLRYAATHPWTVFAPAMFLAALTISLTLFGEALYEEYSPVMRKRWKLWF